MHRAARGFEFQTKASSLTQVDSGGCCVFSTVLKGKVTRHQPRDFHGRLGEFGETTARIVGWPDQKGSNGPVFYGTDADYGHVYTGMMGAAIDVLFVALKFALSGKTVTPATRATMILW